MTVSLAFNMGIMMYLPHKVVKRIEWVFKCKLAKDKQNASSYLSLIAPEALVVSISTYEKIIHNSRDKYLNVLI